MNRQPSDPPANQDCDFSESLNMEQAAILEAELRSLSLRAPSDMLDARIDATLASSISSATPAVPALSAHAKRRWGTGLAIAAAVAIMAMAGLVLYLQPSTPSGPSRVVDIPNNSETGPQHATNQPNVVQAAYHFDPQPISLRWSRDVDAGTLQSKANGPVHAIRRQEVIQRVWVDEERGITIQFIEPSERLLVSKQNTF